MSTPAQIGKNKYRDELEAARDAAAKIRTSLDKMVEEPGPQTRALLIAQAAVALAKLEATISRLEQIGRNSKT